MTDSSTYEMNEDYFSLGKERKYATTNVDYLGSKIYYLYCTLEKKTHFLENIDQYWPLRALKNKHTE